MEVPELADVDVEAAALPDIPRTELGRLDALTILDQAVVPALGPERAILAHRRRDAPVSRGDPGRADGARGRPGLLGPAAAPH